MSKNRPRNSLTAITMALCLAALVVVVGLADLSAQEAPPDLTPPASEAVSENPPNIRVRPLLATDVPLNTAVAIDLGRLSVPDAPPGLTDGVTVKAFARHVEYEDRRIGQLVLTGLEKDGEREALPAGVFSAQFDLTEPRLEADQEVVVEGDATALVAVLEKLAATDDEEEEQPKQAARADRDDRPAGGQNSGGNESNDLAGAYQSPEPVRVAAAAEPVEGTNITTEGCPDVRVDFAQEKAFRQNRTVTIRDGVEVSSTDCGDDLGNSWPLKRSYPACADDVIDPEALTATAQYRWYYVDGGGVRREVSECKADPEKVFAITEKACPVFLDYASLEAVPQAALVYLNDSNVEVQHRGCAASTGREAVALVATTALCSIRHDFAAGRSFQLGTHTYALDGVTYNAGSCAETGVEYAHRKIYTNTAGSFLCPVISDTEAGEAILQHRLEITVGGAPRFITDCTPDAEGTALIATTDTCDNPFQWEHDLTTGVSYGEHKFYISHGGRQQDVTGCVRDGTTYDHNVETVGWQHHDEERFSLPLSTVSITPPGGRYNIAVSQVLDGAARQPYVLQGSEVRETGAVTYEGCSKYLARATTQLWKRADDSIHEKPVGPASRRGPVEACTSSATRNWPKISESTRVKQNSCSYRDTCPGGKDVGPQPCTKTGSLNARTGTYEGRRTVIREDGVEIADVTATRTIQHQGRCGTYWFVQNASDYRAPAVPNKAGVGQSTQWNIDLGWVSSN